MSYGPVAFSSFGASDVVAPGPPSFAAITQVSNKELIINLTLPAVDSDGSELTGLTLLSVATLPALQDGSNPFEGLGMDAILALSGVAKTDLMITPEQAGQQVNVTLPIVNLGGVQYFAAACSD
jgi:hypothetical protein